MDGWMDGNEKVQSMKDTHSMSLEGTFLIDKVPKCRSHYSKLVFFCFFFATC